MNRSRRGFTIVEVLIALAIFAMASLVLIGAYMNVINAYASAAQSSGIEEDIAFARQQLMKQSDIEVAMDGDEFDSTEDRHVRWIADIEPSETIPDLFKVNFEVEIVVADADVPNMIHREEFMLLRPTWSEPVARSNLQAEVRERIAEILGTTADQLGTTPAPAGGGGGDAGGGGRGGRGGRGGGGGGGRGGRGGGDAGGGGQFGGGGDQFGGGGAGGGGGGAGQGGAARGGGGGGRGGGGGAGAGGGGGRGGGG